MGRAVVFLNLLAALAFAQESRVLRFVHVEEPHSLQEASTVIRSTGEIRDVRVDTASRSVNLTGSPWQIELADWIFGRLDRSPTDQRPAIERYEMSGVADPSVRMFHPTRAGTVMGLQEITTIIRSAVEIRRAFTFNRTMSIVMRATPDEISLAEWLFEEMDQRKGERPASEVHRVPGANDDVIRVFYLDHPAEPKELFQQIAAIRNEVKIRRMFTSVSYRAVVARGTQEQVSAAERLLREQKLLRG